MAFSVRPRVFDSPVSVEVTSPLDDPAPPSDAKDEFPILGSVAEDVVTEAYTNVTLRIPQTLYEDYRKVAAAQEQDVEEVLEHRLARCKSHNAVRGLWFSDSERSQLEELLQKRPLDTAAQALSILLKGGTFKMDELEITLTPAQRRVLKLAMYGGRTPQKFFEDMIRRELRV